MDPGLIAGIHFIARTIVLYALYYYSSTGSPNTAFLM